MKTIKTMLDEFIAKMADSYGELIRDDIPEEVFEEVVAQVEKARDEAIVDLSEALRVEALRAADNHPAIKARKLIPHDIVAPVAVPVPNPAPGIPMARDFVAPPPTPPPREVSDTVDPYLQGIPATPPGPAPMTPMSADAFMDPMEGVDHHPPIMTIEEERRMQAGLPRKPLRPRIHHDGKTIREIPMNASLARQAQKPLLVASKEAPDPLVEEEVTNV